MGYYRDFNAEKAMQKLPMTDVLETLKKDKPDLWGKIGVDRAWLWSKEGEIKREDYTDHQFLRSIGFKYHKIKNRWYHNCGHNSRSFTRGKGTITVKDLVA